MFISGASRAETAEPHPKLDDAVYTAAKEIEERAATHCRSSATIRDGISVTAAFRAAVPRRTRSATWHRHRGYCRHRLAWRHSAARRTNAQQPLTRSDRAYILAMDISREGGIPELTNDNNIRAAYLGVA
jgi:hypothetical protein